jgi:murein DD-endopeptidase MepM/ murein hydrolase activator NlpD
MRRLPALALLTAAGCTTTATSPPTTAHHSQPPPQQSSWVQGMQQSAQQTAVVAGRVVSKVAVQGASTATAAYGRMQHYLAEKEVLKTFVDAGEQSETGILAVLHRNRGTGMSAQATHPSTATGSSAASAPSGAAAARTVPLPKDYAGGMRWPLDAGVVSSEYGGRWGKLHKGIDIAADKGEPVYAMADGEVIYAGNGLRGYGNVVIVKHDQHLSSLYAHNTALKVKLGDRVHQGSLIALLGSTGHSTGPHVHFEIRRDDLALNPRLMLPKPALADVIGSSAAVMAGVPRALDSVGR